MSALLMLDTCEARSATVRVVSVTKTVAAQHRGQVEHVAADAAAVRLRRQVADVSRQCPQVANVVRDPLQFLSDFSQHLHAWCAITSRSWRPWRPGPLAGRKRPLLHAGYSWGYCWTVLDSLGHAPGRQQCHARSEDIASPAAHSRTASPRVSRIVGASRRIWRPGCAISQRSDLGRRFQHADRQRDLSGLLG